MTPATRRTLKAKAHALKPVVMIGNDGLTPAVLAEVEQALKSHELIKIRVLGEDRDARASWLAEMCAHTGAAPVQHIGKILVIHRANPVPEASPERVVRGARRSPSKSVSSRAAPERSRRSGRPDRDAPRTAEWKPGRARNTGTTGKRPSLSRSPRTAAGPGPAASGRSRTAKPSRRPG